MHTRTHKHNTTYNSSHTLIYFSMNSKSGVVQATQASKTLSWFTNINHSAPAHTTHTQRPHAVSTHTHAHKHTHTHTHIQTQDLIKDFAKKKRQAGHKASGEAPHTIPRPTESRKRGPRTITRIRYGNGLHYESCPCWMRRSRQPRLRLEDSHT